MSETEEKEVKKNWWMWEKGQIKRVEDVGEVPELQRDSWKLKRAIFKIVEVNQA